MLAKCYLEHKKAVKKWGMEIARKYIRRVNILKAVRHIDELRALPELDYHLLKGDRKGQHVVKLSKGMRLIFTVRDENTVVIEEVSKHYEG